MSHLMNTYARQPVAFSHGEGNWVTDTEGRSYLDALSGIAVSTLGHNHPALVAAIARQASRLLHTSNLYRVPQQEVLSDRLAALSGLEEVFFCNSGCEANEAAIKLARFYGHTRGVDSPAIIVMEHAFHGRTLATLSATGNRKAQAGFEPLVSGFVRVPFNDLAAVRAVAGHNPDVVAVMLEVLQGEGGIHLADPDYLRSLRALCDEFGWLLICDEVQCGIGRTGKWFGYQHSGILPDVATLAKGLGSGVPIGACLAGGRAAGLFKPGNHGSTFGGNPLACTAALTTLDVMEKDGLIDQATIIGERIRQGLASQLAGVSGVVDIRGRGLMIGVELDRPCGELVRRGLDAGLLINVTAERVIRLLPSLVFSAEEADELVTRLSALVRAFLASTCAEVKP
ncbi:aspartate aminotransferase family protein [Rhodocyclus tenuis]|uniref:Acetylornithine aminotransferase n=2 Tax=Rhodocyclus TaxID=1064 RepID=A0A6L5JV75_RHOTE|nr:aspartate aminotransferase family protein [Rhodocyclus gracilis]MQY50514.1 acetylornithine/succinylornithine family transaminase [Rhodocyclus gracilis]MRD72508.1 acetylornithine/succinylornithine family transaminase [Rhodocyclus gracilis]NJA88018.1 aspartate aminotransferase family protein [Rhodocyclus gracilis]